ncbi:MAG: glycosyltransferase [Caldisericia bacterium]|nr:glycosyltransferase [Caldisericia bacterium]MDD4614519.1 glycosyltransferase [Caldisericia bacterium]
MTSATALIPAYNEEITIADVIRACKHCPYIEEVIVIDDGSVDHTSAISIANGADVIRLEHNTGKAMALCTGAQKAKNPVVLLLDADLIGFQPIHAFYMVNPVLESSQISTLGVFSNGRILTDLAHHITPQLSGQRCMPKSILTSLKNMTDVGYGIEILIHRKLKEQGYDIQKVKLDHVTHVTKEEKKILQCHQKPNVEVKKRMEMYKDIFRELSSKKESSHG